MDDVDTWNWNQTRHPPLNESGRDDGSHLLDDYSNFVHVTETTILPSLIGFLCSTGLVGNILVLVTILRTTKKTVPDVYVFNLAVADVVHVTVMPFLIHQWARGGHWVFGSTLCTIITSVDNCNQVACAAVMTAVSLDRYLAVVHPLRLMTLRTRSRTIRINLCVWVVSSILVLPAWLYSEVLRFPDGLESCTLNLVSPSAVLLYTLYQTITSFFLPLPLILTCYFLILTSTWRKYLKTKQLQHEPTQTARDPPHPDGAGSSGRVHGERGALSRPPAGKPERGPALAGLPHLLLPVGVPELRPQLHQPFHLHPAQQTLPQTPDPAPGAQRPGRRQRGQIRCTHTVSQNTLLILNTPTSVVR